MTAETIQQMPRSEKLKLMETLWEDLSQPEAEFESPAWHTQALAETERRLANGEEQALDWEAAKQVLRSQFQ